MCLKTNLSVKTHAFYTLYYTSLTFLFWRTINRKVLSNRLRREFLKYIKCQLQELPVDVMYGRVQVGSKMLLLCPPVVITTPLTFHKSLGIWHRRLPNGHKMRGLASKHSTSIRRKRGTVDM